MNKQARSRWGYVPIVVGLVMIAYGISLLYTHVVVNNELARPNWYFWYYWSLVITFLLVTGSLTTVVGVLISRRVTNIFSIALVAGGFLIISLHSYLLLVDWARPMVNSMSLSNFLGWQGSGIAVGFFSWLMAGAFLVVFGIILGLNAKNRWVMMLVAGGSVLVLLSISLETIIAYDPMEGFDVFRWLAFFDNYYYPIIPFSLIIGVFLIVLGILLVWYQRRETAKIA